MASTTFAGHARERGTTVMVKQFTVLVERAHKLLRILKFILWEAHRLENGETILVERIDSFFLFFTLLVKVKENVILKFTVDCYILLIIYPESFIYAHFLTFHDLY